MEPKLYICGITQNKYSFIKQTVELCEPYVDGFIYVDGGSTDETVAYLMTKKAHIFYRRWSNDHDISMTEFLRRGIMVNGDYYVILDSTDLPNERWIAGLKEDINYYAKNHVGVVLLDRPFIVRYFDHQRIVGNPHWGVSGIIGSIIQLNQIDGYKKEHYVTNQRDTLQSGFLHPAKYYFAYGNSNHTQLLYQQFSDEVWQHHENVRLQFRLYCQQELGIALTLDALADYMKSTKEFPQQFLETVEYEVNLKDVYRLFVLNQPWEKLAENRFNWSLKHYLKTGEIDQPKVGDYVGVFNKYRLQKGLAIE